MHHIGQPPEVPFFLQQVESVGDPMGSKPHVGNATDDLQVLSSSSHDGLRYLELSHFCSNILKGRLLF
jgi:hypothetical protein